MRYTTLLAGIIGLFLLLWGPKALAMVTCEVSPNYIPIHFFYNGAELKISGHADQVCDYVVIIKDEAEKLTLRRKGKVKGLFWMNVGEITFEPVPKVFMVFSNKPLDEILDKSEQEQYDIGYAALFHEVHVEGVPQSEREKWIKEFIKFKENLKLYREKFNAIKVEKEGSGSRYLFDMHWPYQAVPGVYTATVYAIQNDRVIGTCTKVIRVEKVGLLKKITQLAFEKPALYGIISIVIAIIAGVGVGLVFGSKGKH